MQELLFRSPDIFGWLATMSLMVLRYAVFAGIPFLLFYYIRRSDWFHLKIQQKFPKPKQIHTEIGYSLMTFLIFTTIKVGLIWAVMQGYTAAYSKPTDFPLWYLPVSFVLLLAIHDTWFYWTHRLMHHPRVFRFMHKVHHLSTNPTPWASFSFHPSEAVVEFIWLVPVVFFMPLHLGVLMLFVLWMMAFNVVGHLGYELYPQSFLRSPLGKLFNSSTHHNMHHRLFKGNYGLYFNVWDRLMGTNFPSYESYFDEVKERQKQGAVQEIIPNFREQ